MQKLNFSHYFWALCSFCVSFLFLLSTSCFAPYIFIMPINHFCAFLTPWSSLGLKLSPCLQVCWMRHSSKVLCLPSACTKPLYLHFQLWPPYFFHLWPCPTPAFQQSAKFVAASTYEAEATSAPSYMGGYACSKVGMCMLVEYFFSFCTCGTMVFMHVLFKVRNILTR